MKKLKALALVWTLIALPVQSLARVSIRSSSDNGQAGNVVSWKLMEVSEPQTYTANGKTAVITREVICEAQDVNTGQCTSGEYLFLFQIQSKSSNVNVAIGKLLPGYSDAGVMQCDANNDLELCTTDTNPPSLANLANAMTVTVNKSKSNVTFLVPNFPAFPAGPNTEEGQGLTLYVQVNQTAAEPLTYPLVGIH